MAGLPTKHDFQALGLNLDKCTGRAAAGPSNGRLCDPNPSKAS